MTGRGLCVHVHPAEGKEDAPCAPVTSVTSPAPLRGLGMAPAREGSVMTDLMQTCAVNVMTEALDFVGLWPRITDAEQPQSHAPTPMTTRNIEAGPETWKVLRGRRCQSCQDRT